MRTTTAVIATIAIATIGLAGCSSTPSYDGAPCDRMSTDSTFIEKVSVAGDMGSQPQVSITWPLHVAETSYTDLVVGAGMPLTDPDQLMRVDVALYSGSTGEEIVATPFDGDPTRVSSLAGWSAQMPGIAQVLECATAGTRTVAAIAPQDFGETAASSFGLAPSDTVIAVIDISSTLLPAANGAAQFNTGQGLPTVVRDVSGRPGVLLPALVAPPTDLVSQLLLAGDGAEISANEPFWVHYTGVVWETGEVFDSSWERGMPAQLTLDNIIPGLAQALVGQRVGSQIMAIIPPDLGYGPAGTGTIPPNSTLIFVVDILGTN